MILLHVKSVDLKNIKPDFISAVIPFPQVDSVSWPIFNRTTPDAMTTATTIKHTPVKKKQTNKQKHLRVKI